MTHQTTTRTPAVTDLHALAAVARECQLALIEERGAWYCTSATDPTPHDRVTGYTCTCPAFARSQACVHHAMLLDHLGWLPPRAAEPTPIRRGNAPRLLVAVGLALALVAGIPSSPARAETNRPSLRLPIIHAGTDDAAIRLPGRDGPTIQLEHLAEFLVHHGHCETFEDHSIAC